MFNFAKYIEWPENAKSGDFTIGVLGKSTAKDELQKMLQEKVTTTGQRIVVVQFLASSDIKSCQILFVPGNASTQLEAVIEKLKGAATLVVTEKEGQAQKGSSINLLIKEGKMRFEINKEATVKSGLKVSSQLLNLGIVI